MKKLLSILGAITLIGTSSTGIISCKIDNLDDGKRNNIWHWNQMYPINQPFKKVDNKYYVVIWRTSKNDQWKISLFQFKNNNITTIEHYNNYKIEYSVKQGYNSGLMLVVKRKDKWDLLIKRWEDDTKKNEYFKSLYKWDDPSVPVKPSIDEDGNIII